MVNQNYLPFIPADQLENKILWNLPLAFSKSTPTLYLSNQLVAQQNREPDFDLSPAPPAYSLWNMGISVDLFKNMSINLQGNNIFNTEYKDYMNRFRFFTHNMGRNVFLKINYKF